MKRNLSLSLLMLLVAVAFSARAEIKSQPLDYQQGSTPLKGILFFDDKVQGARPAVIVVHEWFGLNDYAKKTRSDARGDGVRRLCGGHVWQRHGGEGRGG